MTDPRPEGTPVRDFVAPPPPGPGRLAGRFVTLERIDAAAHAGDIFSASVGADTLWDYMPYGPFGDAATYADWMAGMAQKSDPFFYAIRDHATGHVTGLASFLRIDPTHGAIELGHILLTPALQRTVAATEALTLMIRWAMDAGYRRFEWKCNALNAPSRRAAIRLGFSFEGVFRQHMIVKGRNRDSAWFSILDGEWPALRAAYDRWLAPANFDANGAQRLSLSDLTAAALPNRRDPG